MEEKKRKMTSRQLKANETKRRIYKAAIELINEHGIENVSIEEICGRAGVSVGGFYHHYKSIEYIAQVGYRFDSYLEKKLGQNKPGGTVFQKILGLIRYKLEYVDNFGNNMMIELYKSQLKQVSNKNDFFFNENRILFSEVLKLIEQGQKEKLIVTEPGSHTLALNLLIFSRGIVYDWCMRDSEYDLIQEGLTAIKTYLYGIMVKKAKITDL